MNAKYGTTLAAAGVKKEGRGVRMCYICRKRPVWHYKGAWLKVCKRCYHKHVWTQRPEARRARGTR